MALAEWLAVSGRRWLVWLALATAVVPAAAGCAVSEWATLSDAFMPPPICHVVPTWHNSVVFAPDPVSNGKMSPFLGGRVYLFGEDLKYPQVGDGGLVVELYDDTAKEPVFLDRWTIDPTTLKRLSKRDFIGWGYSVYLPWTKPSPDVTRLTKVKVRLRYQPATGAPLFNECQVTLSPTNGDVRVQQGGPPLVMPQMTLPQTTALRK
jgi:hypothetical protein